MGLSSWVLVFCGIYVGKKYSTEDSILFSDLIMKESTFHGYFGLIHLRIKLNPRKERIMNDE